MKYYVNDKQKIYGPAEAEKIIVRLNNQTFSQDAQISEDRASWMSAADFLSRSSAVAIPVTPIQAAAPQNEIQPLKVIPVTAAPKKKQKNLFIIIGVVVGILLLGGLAVAGYYIYENF